MILKACTVLGVSPEAGPVEWKRAYRRLAMRWHPDRSDHPEATERFKEINAAYECLLAVDAPENEKTEGVRRNRGLTPPRSPFDAGDQRRL